MEKIQKLNLPWPIREVFYCSDTEIFFPVVPIITVNSMQRHQIRDELYYLLLTTCESFNLRSIVHIGLLIVQD